MKGEPLDPLDRCDELVEAGDALARRPIGEVLDSLGEVGRRWADPDDPARGSAEDALADHHGVPREAMRRLLDAGFVDPEGSPRYGTDALRGWIDAELGDARALDGWISVGDRRRRAFGPRLLVAIASLGVPTTPVEDLVAALCLKAPVWLRPAAGADDLAARLAAVVREVDPDLGEAIETSHWDASGAEGPAVLGRAEVVSATGREATLADLRAALGTTTRLVSHGPRLSVAVVGRAGLEDPEALAAALADDAATGGQLGCLSPVVVYVEGEMAEVEGLVEPVWRACERRWPSPARREAPPDERARWGEWIALAGVERAAGTAGAFAGGPDDAWSVRAVSGAVPPDPPPVPRMVTLAPVDDLERAARLCALRRGLVATVGVAGTGNDGERLAAALSRAGVERIAPLGSMQRPPLGWRRDGRATLADLVRWVDREG